MSGSHFLSSSEAMCGRGEPPLHLLGEWHERVTHSRSFAGIGQTMQQLIQAQTAATQSLASHACKICFDNCASCKMYMTPSSYLS